MNRAPRTMIGIFVFVFVFVFGTTMVSAEAGIQPTVFDGMKTHYESIRQAFLNDTTEGVSGHATHIQSLASDLERTLRPELAGIEPDKATELRRLLPSIRGAASRVAAATTIEAGREAFGDLSKSMVRYRQVSINPDSVVAFCSMAQMVWLQPKGEIGNPYYGQSMARCGEVVSE